MKRVTPLLGIVLFFLSMQGTAWAREVYEIRVNGVISPPVSGFIKDSIDAAHSAKSDALLILLDTPGGLDASMREIVKNIMDAPVPVVVYVSPSGARAASAGTIILIASHVAAMAPGTNVGAAHPVSIGGEKPDKEMMAKVVHDAEAYARSLAAQRGRNSEWAAKAVTQSVSVTADEALKEHVIDVVAPNVDSLLSSIDGRTVEVKGRMTILHTAAARAVKHETPLKYRLLAFLSDPNIAYFLMMIGFYGILFEIYSPGAIFPGVIGGICLILAFYAFQTIPISYAGLFLILLGILFFILELKVTSYGLLGVAGSASIVIGSIMLIDLPSSWLSLSWQSIFAVALLTVVFFAVVLFYALKAQLGKVKTGKEGLIGERGVARTDLLPRGRVFVHGELWDAESEQPVKAGDIIVVAAVDDMTVKVTKERGE
jgi:membrane-bound serine protease (ClpP class)